MAFIASATTRIAVNSGVIILPARHFLAHQEWAATEVMPIFRPSVV
jgi:alkanesulfonate monooxygenase SsuD/methylene tetrahydromethanopterin reductase-like flavin-dependent oxidoreductase (luciferase family)